VDILTAPFRAYGVPEATIRAFGLLRLVLADLIYAFAALIVIALAALRCRSKSGGSRGTRFDPGRPDRRGRDDRRQFHCGPELNAVAADDHGPGTSVRDARSRWMKTPLAMMLVTAVLTASLGPASGQAPPTPKTPGPPTAPAQPSQSADCTQRGAASDGLTTGQAGQPLSDKLAKSDGVLCPPSGVDPEIRAPTPDTGKMPVIPPPGGPGGDPSVRPK